MFFWSLTANAWLAKCWILTHNWEKGGVFCIRCYNFPVVPFIPFLVITSPGFWCSRGADIHPRLGSSPKTIAEQGIEPAGPGWVISRYHASRRTWAGQHGAVLGSEAAARVAPGSCHFPGQDSKQISADNTERF